MALVLQCSLREPDVQDVASGMDTYCLVLADQAAAYGVVAEVTLRAGVLRLVVIPDAVETLGIADPVIEAVLIVDDPAIERLRRGLRRVLAYGRPDARPAVIQL
jgi:hypothetical protein